MSAALATTTQVDLTAGFAPFVQSFVQGTYTITIPTGSSQLIIALIAGGGSGYCSVATSGASTPYFGGGGGGYVRKTIAINSLDWGKSTSSIIVGAGGFAQATAGTNGNNGGNSNFNAAWISATINMLATGGSGGTTTSAAGGTASGGDTNTSGGNGTSGSGPTGKGGDGGPGGNGGYNSENNGFTPPQAGNIPGGGGGAAMKPEKQKGSAIPSGPGASGYLILSWS